MERPLSTSVPRTPPSQRVPAPDRRQRGWWAVQCALILLLVWLALTGLDALLLGVFAAVLGGLVSAWIVPGRPYPWRPLRLLRFGHYFLWTSIRGGIDVAWRAMHPRLAIAPGWLRYRMVLPPGQPRTLMVSVLSLVPGTLSADLEADDTLLVHVLVGDDPEAIRADVARLEREIRLFFSLPIAGSETDA